MDSGNNYQSIIGQKCSHCYKKDWCMCLPSQRALLCLGPFRDEEDNERKHIEDREKEEKPKASMESLERESRIAEYWIKRSKFEFKSGRGKQDDDETKE